MWTANVCRRAAAPPHKQQYWQYWPDSNFERDRSWAISDFSTALPEESKPEARGIHFQTEEYRRVET